MQIFREEYQKDTCISAMSMDADAKHVMSQWKEINNPALRWLKERTITTPSASLDVVNEAYIDYRNWCRDNGHRELNSIHFSRQIARSVKRVREGNGSVFLNISLRPIESRHFNVLD
jgi:phage/plasmid-associated DNA primase